MPHRSRSLVLVLACTLGACASHPAQTSHGGAGSGAGSGTDAFGNPTGTAGTEALRDAGLLYASFADRPCPTDSTLTYESFGAGFFANYCEPCHSSQNVGTARNGAPAGVSFDDLASIQMRRKAIWDMAGDDNTRMPASTHKPSMAERTQLGAWLACGAQGASSADAGSP